MNLYLISQDVNNDYDTYDSAVVAAESEDDARKIHPSGYAEADWWLKEQEQECFSSWSPCNAVQVKPIGTAVEGTSAGVICASFNAG